MPIAAVPEYFGKQDFSGASPGMRFGMYLPIWTERADQEKQIRKMAEKKSREGQALQRILDEQDMEKALDHVRRERGRLPGLWTKNDDGAKSAWREVTELRSDDRDRMTALVRRQDELRYSGHGGELAVFDGLSVAPFTTGLGNEHPLENGFAFLWPYGLPYLPGSGVKGVLRQAARGLATDVAIEGVAKWDVQTDWCASAIDVLFGGQDSNDAQRGALIFWDVMPQITGNHLLREVMTGHQSHYYMGNESPHESGMPSPVYFLTVPPSSRFAFHVACDLPFLRRVAPHLAENDRWKQLLHQAFAHAFDWIGFGGKTAVGYGAMVHDTEAEERREEERRARAAKHQAAEEARRREEEQQAALARMSPVERSIREFLDQRQDKNQPEISAVINAVKQGRWQGEEKVQVARWLEMTLQAKKRWKEQSHAKKPEKDRDYQNTLLVKTWLEGK